MIMNKFTVILFLFVAILFSCSEEDPYAVPKRMNMGYLFDSLEYEQEKWLDCGGNHDTTGMGAHKYFCTMFGFVPYKKLEYAEKDLKDVIFREGKPDCFCLDTLHYGFCFNKRKGWIFPFDDFDSECEEDTIIPCQSLYRIQRLLNHPTCLMQISIWHNSSRYLRLYSLVSDSENKVFWGCQASVDYHNIW